MKPALVASQSVKTPFTDTSKKTQEIQDRLFAEQTPTERLQRALDFSDWAIEMSRRAIARTHAGLSEMERNLFFVEVHYGRDLARKIRAFLEKRNK